MPMRFTGWVDFGAAMLSMLEERRLCETDRDRWRDEMAVQTYQNHTRVDVGYYALQLLNLTLVITAFLHLGRVPDVLHLLLAGLALGLLSAVTMTRRYAIQNQNRLIRLEENVRLHWMNIDPSGLTLRQLIALRFAPDAELTSLVARARAENLSGKQIKEAITTWRADHDRV